MAIVDEMIKLAQSQVGYTETGNNHNKYAQYFDTEKSKGGPYMWFCGKKQNVPWCAIWICWLFVMVLRPILGDADKVRVWLKFPKPAENYAAGCPYLWQYLVNRGWKVDKTKGKPGDIIFFNAKCTHVGIIEKVENGKYYTIEGNKGNKVARGTYNFNSSTIYGLCRPDYSDIEPKPEPVPASSKYKVSVNSFLSLRDGTNTSCKELGRLYNGAIVTITEQSNGWGRVGDNLWCSMQYLKSI